MIGRWQEERSDDPVGGCGIGDGFAVGRARRATLSVTGCDR
jgi:hypothetical protein